MHFGVRPGSTSGKTVDPSEARHRRTVIGDCSAAPAPVLDLCWLWFLLSSAFPGRKRGWLYDFPAESGVMRGGGVGFLSLPFLRTFSSSRKSCVLSEQIGLAPFPTELPL